MQLALELRVLIGSSFGPLSPAGFWLGLCKCIGIDSKTAGLGLQNHGTLLGENRFIK